MDAFLACFPCFGIWRRVREEDVSVLAATAQVTIPWVVLMVTARTTTHIPSPRHRPHPSYTSTPPSSLVFQRHLESVRLCSSLSPSILGQRVGRDPAERAQ